MLKDSLIYLSNGDLFSFTQNGPTYYLDYVIEGNAHYTCKENGVQYVTPYVARVVWYHYQSH